MSVHDGDWKLIRFYAEGKGQTDRLELYDRENDPGEERDLAGQHPAKVTEMNGMIDQYLASMAALVPVPNPAYSPESAR